MKNKFLISFFTAFLLLTSTPVFSDELDDATIFYNEAIDLYKQDEVEKSIDLFTKATELNSEFYEAYYNLAQILMSLNKNEEAVKAFEQIAKIKPDDTESLYNLGKLQYKRGYLSSAHRYLTMIEKGAPQYDSAKILIEKIEKRQGELSIEAKLKEHKVTKDAQGKVISAELGDFSAPSGITLDAQGNIYVASFLDNCIYKVSIHGQKTVFSKSSLIKGPIGVAIDKNGNTYVANYNVNNIVKITPNGVATIFADIQKPYCIVYDKEHDRLYVTEQNTNKLVKFDL